MKGLIGICLGDVAGIGPEVTLKALAAQAETDPTGYVLFGDLAQLSELNGRLGLNLALEPWSATGKPGRIAVHNPLAQPLPSAPQREDPAGAHAAMAWLKEAAEWCLQGRIEAMVTAPVSKEAMVRAGYRFVGQTEYLSESAQTKRTAMMLLGQDDRGRWLRVALATRHVPIRLVAEQLTQEAVELAIDLAAQACGALELPRARVAVCGLNPHAGEGGKMGTEEITIIGPAVAAARARGLEVTGPLSADALFYYAYRGDYEAVVAMYHDQGLAPLKMVCFEQGVNWTLGLPFIRTSPDHGTAYDIAGRGIANPSSMIAALRLAKQLAAGRG
jgi:4-hydroxythreonine-4-phosphate dehydrogenase